MFFKSRLALLFLIILGLSIIAAGYKCTCKVVFFLSRWMLNGGHRRGGKSPVTLSRQVRESTPLHLSRASRRRNPTDGDEGWGTPPVSAPASAPTASGSGTWPVFIDPRSETKLASLASRSRADQGRPHGPTRPSGGRSGLDRAAFDTALRAAARHAGHGESEPRFCLYAYALLAFWFRCPPSAWDRTNGVHVAGQSER
jgi:hypothetical protein